MNTAGYNIAMIPKIGFNKYEIILDDLEFIFPVKTLEKVKRMHNFGFSITEISTETKRDEYEILLAIIHLHRKGKITRRIRVS